jgi:hypothetical protein
VRSGGRRRLRLGCGGRSALPGGSSAGGRSGRPAHPGSGGAAALTSLGAWVPPLESSPWLGQAGGCPRAALRPVAPRTPFGSLRCRESPAAGARFPAALGARRLQPGREQWSRSWCPGGGARGEGSRPPPGVSRPRAPPLQNPATAPHASGSPRSIALRGPLRRCLSDCSTGTLRPAGCPSDRRKVHGLRCFSSCGAHSRPGRRGRRNALSTVSGLFGRCRPAPGTARVPRRAAAGPAFRLPLAVACSEAAAPVAAEALRALCAGEARGLALSLPPALVPPPPLPLQLPAGPCSSQALAARSQWPAELPSALPVLLLQSGHLWLLHLSTARISDRGQISSLEGEVGRPWNPDHEQGSLPLESALGKCFLALNLSFPVC